MTRARRILRTLLGIVLAPVVWLVVAAATTPLPAEFGAKPAYEDSVRVLDREGRVLREVRAGDAARARWVSRAEAGDRVRLALLAAEDRRFYSHPGVDPVGVVRAAMSDLLARRVVSGASTLTMQLARVVRPHPRTLLGKFGEMALALRIEASLDKGRILEEYENRAPFGPNVRGVEAASRMYFDKPASELSWAEAATLAAIPRGPTVYDPERHADRTLRRRDRILDRMMALGWISKEDHRRAKDEPLALNLGEAGFGAPHFVQAVLAEPWLREGREVTTTIDRKLQREAEMAVLSTLRPLRAKHVSAASVIVLDNATGEVLAYVGSPGFDDPRGGQNDGVRARRQPGSTLKPFLYGLAMDRLGFTGATLLPDVELAVADEAGTYRPRDYDERFRGPVRLREALGSSLNVPAVWTLEQVGTASFLERLHALGFASLQETPEHYGAAIALGDGEVTLLELANAYATLARHGKWKPVRTVREARSRAGSIVASATAPEVEVMSRASADMLADILADGSARVGAFGERSVLELPFEAAAKTGTSKGFRDNWTAGFTREVTVAVWAGNFDGSAMQSVSGITGAGPIFRAVMEAAMRNRPRAPVAAQAAGDLVRVEVCALSGDMPGPGCKHHVHEWLPRARLPLAECEVHDPKREGERWTGAYAAWARQTGRDVIADRPTASRLQIAYPAEGARFAIDPERPASLQSILVRVEGAPAGTDARLFVDGAPASTLRDGAAPWRLARGEHVFVARAGDRASDPVRVLVQ
jgi:penicillin-binding protein 1C